MRLSVLNLAVGISLANAAIAADSVHTEAETTKQQGVSILEKLVVSGEKQERSLKDTISSVSVVGDEKLQTTQYVTVRDAIKDTPNVLALDGVVPNIRGVEGNGAAGGFYGVSGGANARVSMLVDGVVEPFLAVFSGDSGLWDLEQIEVFRGPQSTNNGRNSIAGSLYLKTKDPSFDWEGKVRLAYRDNQDYFDKAVMLSGPIIEDTLAFRFTGQMLDAQTLTNNEEVAGNPAHYDLNEFNSDKARFKLLWTPNDDLEALLTYSKFDEQGDLGRRYYTNETDYILAYPQEQLVDNDSLSLNIDYALSSSMSLNVLLANRDYAYKFNSYAATAEQEQQFAIKEDGTTFDTKLNFGENSKTVYGHLGLAYFEREQDIDSVGSFVYDGSDSSDSKALYGEVNYAITDKLTLTGGMRYQQEQQIRDFNFPHFDLEMDLDVDEDVFLPSIALQYDVTDNTRVGLSAKKGYNSAGGAVHPVVGTPFYYDEETVNAYELTTRSSLANDTITLSANLFYNDYSGYQAPNGPEIVNVKEAETFGLELQTTAMVTEDLELNLGLGLLSSEIKNGGNITNITGNNLSFAPETTATLGFTYFLNNHLDLGASLRYTGSYDTDLTNTEATKVKGYSTVNLTANYEHGPWLISGFINNVTDKEHVISHSFYGSPSYSVELLEPRTVGLSATYTFL